MNILSKCCHAELIKIGCCKVKCSKCEQLVYPPNSNIATAEFKIPEFNHQPVK